MSKKVPSLYSWFVAYSLSLSFYNIYLHYLLQFAREVVADNEDEQGANDVYEPHDQIHGDLASHDAELVHVRLKTWQMQ